MSNRAEIVAALFRQACPYPEELENLFRDRSEAFVETLMYEIECFE